MSHSQHDPWIEDRLPILLAHAEQLWPVLAAGGITIIRDKVAGVAMVPVPQLNIKVGFDVATRTLVIQDMVTE
jgi:hypothetical protein